MDFLKKNNGVITIILLILLLVSATFIIQLEIKASSLQSRLEEHHKQLQANSDVLNNLHNFERGTSNSNIQVTENNASLKSGKAFIDMKDNKILIETPEDIKLGNGSDIKFGYDKVHDGLYMFNKDSKFYIATLTDNTGETDDGFYFKTKTGVEFQIRNFGVQALIPSDNGNYWLRMSQRKKFVELKKDKSIIRMEGDDINIESKGNITIKASDDIKFGYDKEHDGLYMFNKDSKFYVATLADKTGETDDGFYFKTKTGVEFQVRNFGVQALIPGDNGDYWLRMSQRKKFVELKKDNSIIRMEGDDVKIEAEGDINITSKNGKVNINGKR